MHSHTYQPLWLYTSWKSHLTETSMECLEHFMMKIPLTCWILLNVVGECCMHHILSFRSATKLIHPMRAYQNFSSIVFVLKQIKWSTKLKLAMEWTHIHTTCMHANKMNERNEHQALKWMKCVGYASGKFV